MEANEIKGAQAFGPRPLCFIRCGQCGSIAPYISAGVVQQEWF